MTLAAGELTVKIINFGAVIRDVRFAGVDHPLVLGFDSFDRLRRPLARISAPSSAAPPTASPAAASTSMARRSAVPERERRTHLHGGFNGFGKRAWRARRSSRPLDHPRHRPARRRGRLSRQRRGEVRYTVEAPATIRMEAAAATDAPTLVNLAQHSYFNLDDSPDILDHRVTHLRTMPTRRPTPSSIPTGEILPVAGTDYDFRESAADPPDARRRARRSTTSTTSSPGSVPPRRAASPVSQSPKNGVVPRRLSDRARRPVLRRLHDGHPRARPRRAALPGERRLLLRAADSSPMRPITPAFRARSCAPARPIARPAASPSRAPDGPFP